MVSTDRTGCYTSIPCLEYHITASFSPRYFVVHLSYSANKTKRTIGRAFFWRALFLRWHVYAFHVYSKYFYEHPLR